MNSHPDSERQPAFATNAIAHTFLSNVSVAVVVLLALLVLLGWQCDLSLLKRGYPGSPSTMKANAALCFLLAGLALGLLQLEPTIRTVRLKKQLGWMGTSFALSVVLIGLLTLSQYLFGWQLGLDELLFRDVAPSATTRYPGRMGENTAINFVLVGNILWLLQQNTRSRVWLAQSLSCLVLLLALLPLMGHLFGVSPTYRLVTGVTTMAAHTAVTFIVLCMGLFLSRPDQGFMRTITSPFAGGVMARSLLPWAIVIPLTINWLTFQGEQRGWYDPAFGYAGRIVAIAMALSSVVWLNARLLNRQDQQKQRLRLQLEASEQQLALANASLERQVAERTAALAQTNDRLQQELVARTLTEQKLQDIVTLQQAILDGANHMIIATTVDGTITAFNAAAERSLGYAANEVIDRVTPALIHDPAEVEQYAQVLSQELGTPMTPGFDVFVAKALRGNVDEREWTYTRKDGSRFPILLSVTALHDSAGQLTGFLGIGMDISDRKRLEAEREQAEQALQDSEARYRSVVDSLAEGIVLQQADGSITTCNASAELILGLSSAQMMGLRSVDPQWCVIHEDGSPFPGAEHPAMVALRTGQPQYKTIMGVHKPDGSLTWISVNAQPMVHPDDAQPYAVVASFVDITHLKQVERSLRQSEARNRALVEALPDLLIQMRSDGIYLDFVSGGRVELYNPQSFYKGVSIYDMLPYAHAQERMFYVQQALQTKTFQRYEYELLINGNTHFEEARIVANGEDEVLIIIRNITARRQSEAALLRSEQEFRTLAENSPDIISRFDRNLRYVYASPLIEQFTGIPAAAFIGKTHQELDIRKEDALLWDTFIKKVFATGKEELIEFSFLTPHGLKYYQSCLVPEVTPSGAVETVLVANRDLTQLKEAEIGLKQLTLTLEQRNQELQSFAYIASHDLKEPLRTTRNFCSLLQSKCRESLDDRGRDYIDRIQNATQRMQTLIDDLLSLSRVTTDAKPFAPVALAQIVGEVVSSLGMQLERTGGRVEVGELPTVSGDATQLAQLLQNLISNALKFHGAMAPVVKIYSQRMHQADGDRAVQILVEDNGIGFEEQYRDRIFETFERLHGRSEFEGTGIGLALCRKIVERHGGSIIAQSVLGQGSTFIITLFMP